MLVELLAAAGSDAAVEGDVEGAQGGLPAVGPANPSLAGGVELQTVRYNTFNADCSVGKWPRALTARRNRALSDSMALVPGMKSGGGPRGVPLVRQVDVGHTV